MDALKKITEKAGVVHGGVYDEFILVPTDEPYDGFWGNNGYNCIQVYARRTGHMEDFVRLDMGCSDAFWIRGIRSMTFDVPTEYPCIRFIVDEPIEIYSQLSTISAGGKK